MSDGTFSSYNPVLPISQYKGHDPYTGILYYYQFDAAHKMIARFDFQKNTWEFVDPNSGHYFVPNDLEPAINSSEMETIRSEVYSSGNFKLKTDYIIVGDEPVGGKGVLNLEAKLGKEKYEDFKKLMMFMPRSYLRGWFDKNIMPSLSLYGNFENMVWAAFIDVFNEANLEYIKEKGIDPWSWEQEKLHNYYLAENKPVLDELNERFNNYKELNTAPDPEASALMREYQSIPKIGDLGLEISRQFAIKELLARKEYATVKGIIESYKYANDTILSEAINKPLPFDIVIGDKVLVKSE